MLLNYFLYLLTTISIYLSSIKCISVNFPIDNKYRFALIIVEIILIFSLSFVKNQNITTPNIPSYNINSWLYTKGIFRKIEYVNKDVIEDVLKKMLVIILICFAITVKISPILINSFLIFSM